MNKYACEYCDYVYDPEVGDPSNDIPQGTPLDDLPYDWTCPDCGATKDYFEPVSS